MQQETCDGKDVRSVVKGLGQVTAGGGICLVGWQGSLNYLLLLGGGLKYF